MMNDNKKSLNLTLVVTSLEEGFVSTGDEMFTPYYTDLKGLGTLVQNADTVQIICAQDVIGTLLLDSRINAEHVSFRYVELEDRPVDTNMIQVLIDPYVGIGKNILTEIYVPKELGLDIKDILNKS